MIAILNRMRHSIKEKLILLSIVLFGSLLRLVGGDWDQGQHLHPDERFLTMVGNAMHIPATFAQYLDPHTSPLNPANSNFSFFVYGLLPVTLNKLLAVFFRADTYQGFTLQGRMLSGFFDIITILFVYKIVELLEKKHSTISPSVKFLAAFCYAIAVLPIQLSHFFATDTFLNAFVIGSFYFSLRYFTTGKIYSLYLSLMLFSLALASKVSAIYILPLNAYFLFTGLFMCESGHWMREKDKRLLVSSTRIVRGIILSGFGVILAYLTLRVSDPYLFESGNIFDVHISQLFLQNLHTLKSWEDPQVWFPPIVQWISKPPITFALYNMSFFGVGLLYFVLLLWGMGLSFREKKLSPITITFIWVLLFFLYQSTQFVKNMRYFIFLYPFMAIAAGIALAKLFNHAALWLRVFCLGALLVWPLAYFSIYVHLQSRVQASEWIYQNIPVGSNLAYEHWDDALPLQLPTYTPSQYVQHELKVFDPDTPEKWQAINETLRITDYYILTSNRAWGSIPTAAWKYPLGSKYYQDLFAGKRGYTLVKEVTSYPSLRYLGIPIDFPDDSAEESFTVYDHPKVLIYKNNHAAISQ